MATMGAMEILETQEEMGPDVAVEEEAGNMAINRTGKETPLMVEEEEEEEDRRIQVGTPNSSISSSSSINNINNSQPGTRAGIRKGTAMAIKMVVAGTNAIRTGSTTMAAVPMVQNRTATAETPLSTVTETPAEDGEDSTKNPRECFAAWTSSFGSTSARVPKVSSAR